VSTIPPFGFSLFRLVSVPHMSLTISYSWAISCLAYSSITDHDVKKRRWWPSSMMSRREQNDTDRGPLSESSFIPCRPLSWRAAFPLRKFFKESLTHGPLNLCVNEKTVRVNDLTLVLSVLESHCTPSNTNKNHNAALGELHWLPWPVVWRCELCCLLTGCVAV